MKHPWPLLCKRNRGCPLSPQNVRTFCGFYFDFEWRCLFA
nr:MAG TPA: hypothetical protein [Caudoviricetes sp.]